MQFSPFLAICTLIFNVVKNSVLDIGKILYSDTVHGFSVLHSGDLCII